MVNNNQTDLLDILIGTKKIVPSTSKNEVKTDKEKKTDTNKEKNMGGRTPKNEKYAEERKQVLNKILKILELTEKNDTFYVNDLESNDKKIEQIKNLVNDIKQYFPYSMWAYFSKPNLPYPYTSLVRSILRDMKIEFASVSVINNKTKEKTQGYKIYF